MEWTDMKQLISMLEQEAYQLELEREQLAAHLSLVRNLRDAADAYISSMREMKENAVLKDMLAKTQPTIYPVRCTTESVAKGKAAVSSSVKTDNTSPDSINHISSIRKRQQNVTSDVFEGLSQREALFKYLSLCAGKKQTPWEIEEGLRVGGFEPKSFCFSESLNSMLRYYERKGLVTRDDMYGWRLAKQKNDYEKLSVERNRNGRFTTDSKSAAEYCAELLGECGKPALHVNEFVAMLNEKYKLNKTKDVIAATLRKNAKNKRFFESLGKNQFGLLRGPDSKANSLYRQIP